MQKTIVLYSGTYVHTHTHNTGIVRSSGHEPQLNCCPKAEQTLESHTTLTAWTQLQCHCFNAREKSMPGNRFTA